MKKTFYLYLLICLLHCSFTFASSDETLVVVHEKVANNFTVNGYDFQYDENKVPFAIQLGSLFFLQYQETVYLPDDSYQIIYILRDPETGDSYSFTSRIINNRNENAIKKVVLKSRKMNTDYKATDGIWKPWKVYQITFMDDSIYDLEWREKGYDSIQEAYEVYDRMEMSEGDTVSFSPKKDYPLIDTYFAVEVFHEGEKKSGNFIAIGQIRNSNTRENQSDMHFAIAKAISVNCTFFRYDLVTFKNFGIGYDFWVSCSSPLRIPDLQKCTSLEYIRSTYHNRDLIFIFKNSEGKEAHLKIRYDSWTGTSHALL